MRSLPLSLLCAAAVGPAAAQTTGPRRPLAIEDYYRIRTAGQPLLSPDGKWVAFTLTTRTEATNADSIRVWLVPADGSVPERQLSPPGINARNPEWRRDGRLSYSVGSEREIVDPAAPDERRERTAPLPSRGEPSPDGRWTARVHSLPAAPPAASFRSEFERRHEERFRGRIFDWLDFQRDGSPYPVPNPVDPAVTPAQEIFLEGPHGGEPRQLTRLGLRPQEIGWSPDGSAVVFRADSTYRDERSYSHAQVWLAALDGTVRRLTPDLDNNYTGAAFSPDGRWVLTTRTLSTDAVIARRLNHGGPTDLVLLPVAGGPERVLTEEWDHLPQAPRWSPDGRWVYFTGGIGGTTHLFRVGAEGGPVEQITSGPRRLTGFSFDHSFRRMAYTAGVMDAPADIWIAEVDGRNERRLTNLNQELIGEVALDSAERLHFTSRDGTPIEGWLYRPPGSRPGGGAYPLIVFSHGGPHSAYGYGFDFKLQYFAASGYFVLTTNFRGSTGYGEKFLWATWGGWGNKDGEDVMAGVDHVLRRYPIDPRRVATIGHSYGGFLSNWLITQYPDRFAAAVVGAGISNWVSDYGTADIARTKETEFYGTPWDPAARDLMMKQSPLSYANRVKAATLFVHGELDERVPYSEAEQMYVALKKNGVPAKMIQYAGQYHGISGSWNVVHRILNELRWLDRYLKSPALP